MVVAVIEVALVGVVAVVVAAVEAGTSVFATAALLPFLK